MADKRISQLTEATTMTSQDLFVIEQDSQTKKVKEQTFINSLANALDGHGGINTIAKTSTSGLIDTYTITFADQTTTTFTVTNGAVGATGDSAYVYVRYSTNQPTQDSDVHAWADRWMGTATGNSPTAPTAYTAYTWYDTKGQKGDTGDSGVSPTLVYTAVDYCDSESGTEEPQSGWSSTIPTPVDGHFLWTRITIEFSVGDPIVAYAVAKNGSQGGGGSGSVTSVAVAAASGGGLTVSGSPITSSGTITIGHSNASITAQTTQGLYPIKIDSKGHITSYGSAATASSVGAIANPASKTQGQVLTYDGSNWTAANPTGAVQSVNGYTGAVVLSVSDISGAMPSASFGTFTATIATSAWSGTTATVSVSGIKADSVIMVSPDASSYSDWASAKIRCTAQSANSVTFTCDSVPTASVTANLFQVG